MKKLSTLFLSLCLTGFPIFAQTTTPTTTTPAPTLNLIAGGVSFQPGGSPSTAGTAIYARNLTSSTWAFTIVDALPLTKTPFTVSLDTAVGVAISPFNIGRAKILIPTAAGPTFTGSNQGWNWSTGAGALIKADGNFSVMPAVRIIKSSVNANQGYGFIVGVYMAWGF